jgi:hypothetical protein
MKFRHIFLGVLPKLRKATISFVMSVRLYVRMEQLGSHWTDFHEIWYLYIFRKSVEKIQVLLKSDKNNGHGCAACHTPHSTQYTQHILPQHSNNFNDVFLLIIPQIL